MTYVPRKSALDAALSVNASVTFLVTYFCTYVNVKAVKVRNTVFLPPPFGILLIESYQSPVQAWYRLRCRHFWGFPSRASPSWTGCGFRCSTSDPTLYPLSLCLKSWLRCMTDTSFPTTINYWCETYLALTPTSTTTRYC